MTPSVDVAIVAYRHWDLTRSCLEHLAQQTVAHRVTLCDNGCDEGTAERVAAEYPDVEVVRLERNMPYAVACNRAVANGRAELVVMMNNDVNVRPNFIERVVAPFAADPGLGSVGTLLLRPGEERIDSAGMVIDTTLSGFTRREGGRRKGRAARPGVTGAYGAAAAFRRAAWEQVGGLDETIPAYCEDLDLALRLRQAGWPARWRSTRSACTSAGRRSGTARRISAGGPATPRLCAAPLRGAANPGRARARLHRGDRGRRRLVLLSRDRPLAGTGGWVARGRRASPRERHRPRPRWTTSSDSSNSLRPRRSAYGQWIGTWSRPAPAGACRSFPPTPSEPASDACAPAPRRNVVSGCPPPGGCPAHRHGTSGCRASHPGRRRGRRDRRPPL